MKYLIAIIFLQLFFIQAQTQEETVAQKPNKKQAIYMEVGGNGYESVTLNYERFFGVENDFGLRLGLGYLLYENKEYFSFPLESIFKIGSKKHKFEAGVGITYYIKAVYGSEGGSIFFIGRLGYSYNGENGLLIRVGFTPMYEPSQKFFKDNTINPYAGISIGYAF